MELILLDAGTAALFHCAQSARDFSQRFYRSDVVPGAPIRASSDGQLKMSATCWLPRERSIRKRCPSGVTVERRHQVRVCATGWKKYERLRDGERRALGRDGNRRNAPASEEEISLLLDQTGDSPPPLDT